jgi:hypothetical protein
LSGLVDTSIDYNANSSKSYDLRERKGKTITVNRYNKDNNIDEWYKLTIQCDPYRYGNGEGSGDSYGYVEVDNKFEIRDAGTPVETWENFGFLLVHEYDNLNCKYDIYEEIAPAAKQLHPSYIPTAMIADTIKEDISEEIDSILASFYGATPPVVTGISKAENGYGMYNETQSYKLLSKKGQTLLIHRYNHEVDEWYKLVVECYLYNDVEVRGFVSVDEKFEIADEGDFWNNFGFLSVDEYDGNVCQYDLYDDLTAQKVLDPRYLPISAILPPVTAADNGKVLMVVDGEWKAVSLNQ